MSKQVVTAYLGQNFHSNVNYKLGAFGVHTQRIPCTFSPLFQQTTCNTGSQSGSKPSFRRFLLHLQEDSLSTSRAHAFRSARSGHKCLQSSLQRHQRSDTKPVLLCLFHRTYQCYHCIPQHDPSRQELYTTNIRRFLKRDFKQRYENQNK